MTTDIYQTERLILRRWEESDKPAFAAICSDPRVMEFFPALRSREESDQIVDECNRRLARDGFTFWAVERKEDGNLVGSVGLSIFEADLPFCPCVEIGWRLAFEHWGNGYATEAATQCLSLGFTQLGLDEIVSFTTLANTRSRHVMEKIGMQNTGQNFMHPTVDVASGLKEHCLYHALKSKE